MTESNPIKILYSLFFEESAGSNATVLASSYVSQRAEERAIVSDTIRPDQNGRVRFQGSWWPARCEQNIILLPGQIVHVIGRQNITLLVTPVTQMIPASVC